MGKFKELQVLESNIFEAIEEMHIAICNKDITAFRGWLALLENLNDEYNFMTGNFYIAPMEILMYHSYQWSRF